MRSAVWIFLPFVLHAGCVDTPAHMRAVTCLDVATNVTTSWDEPSDKMFDMVYTKCREEVELGHDVCLFPGHVLCAIYVGTKKETGNTKKRVDHKNLALGLAVQEPQTQAGP